ncbi:MAG TPA: hypothetical protein VI669_19495, partial [Vicinamibacteria bacterium]
MSKSNVNPNHYKVAGRERQGEDITQTRYKQKLAESEARRRLERNPRFRNPALASGAVEPDARPTRAAQKGARKAVKPLVVDQTGRRGATRKRAPRATDTEGQARPRSTVTRPAPAVTAKQAKEM